MVIVAIVFQMEVFDYERGEHLYFAGQDIECFWILSKGSFAISTEVEVAPKTRAKDHLVLRQKDFKRVLPVMIHEAWTMIAHNDCFFKRTTFNENCICSSDTATVYRIPLDAIDIIMGSKGKGDFSLYCHLSDKTIQAQKIKVRKNLERYLPLLSNLDVIKKAKRTTLEEELNLTGEKSPQVNPERSKNVSISSNILKEEASFLSGEDNSTARVQATNGDKSVPSIAVPRSVSYVNDLDRLTTLVKAINSSASMEESQTRLNLPIIDSKKPNNSKQFKPYLGNVLTSFRDNSSVGTRELLSAIHSSKQSPDKRVELSMEDRVEESWDQENTLPKLAPLTSQRVVGSADRVQPNPANNFSARSLLASPNLKKVNKSNFSKPKVSFESQDSVVGNDSVAEIEPSRASPKGAKKLGDHSIYDVDSLSKLNLPVLTSRSRKKNILSSLFTKKKTESSIVEPSQYDMNKLRLLKLEESIGRLPVITLESQRKVSAYSPPSKITQLFSSGQVLPGGPLRSVIRERSLDEFQKDKLNSKKLALEVEILQQENKNLMKMSRTNVERVLEKRFASLPSIGSLDRMCEVLDSALKKHEATRVKQLQDEKSERVGKASASLKIFKKSKKEILL